MIRRKGGWKPQVEVNGQWAGNSLVFATKEEADNSAYDLMQRWLLCTDSRAIETDAEPTHSYDGRELKPLPHTEAEQQMVADYVQRGLGEE